MSASNQAPISETADIPLAAEDPHLQPLRISSETSTYLTSSGSVYGEGDWLAGGFATHTNTKDRSSLASHGHKAAEAHASEGSTADKAPTALHGQQIGLPAHLSNTPILESNYIQADTQADASYHASSSLQEQAASAIPSAQLLHNMPARNQQSDATVSLGPGMQQSLQQAADKSPSWQVAASAATTSSEQQRSAESASHCMTSPTDSTQTCIPPVQPPRAATCQVCTS